MNGYLNVRQAAAFLGGRSVSWLRSHLHDVPHLKLYDRLLFDPAELRKWVEATAKRHLPVDLDEIARELDSLSRRKGFTGRPGRVKNG